MICTHLWRCTLLLCLQTKYDAALLCVQLSAAIGSVRPINNACARNTLFFLDQLLQRVRNSPKSGTTMSLEEELLAYASADLQSSLEHSWAWTSTSTHHNNSSSPTSSAHPSSSSSDQTSAAAALPIRSSNNYPAPLEQDADDAWGQVEHLIRTLVVEEEKKAGMARLKSAPAPALAPSPMYYPAQHNPVKRVQLASDAAEGGKRLSEGASRISIANII
jgi:hypothetical protein